MVLRPKPIHPTETETKLVGGHLPVLLTKHSMFGMRPQTSVQSRAYWIFLDKLFIMSTFFSSVARSLGASTP